MLGIYLETGSFGQQPDRPERMGPGSDPAVCWILTPS